jgi:hypothetical protein
MFIKAKCFDTTWVIFRLNTCKNTKRQEDIHPWLLYSNTKDSDLQPDNEAATSPVYNKTENFTSSNQLYLLSTLPQHQLLLIKH